MTYEEFLEKLRATPRTWRLESGCIRTGYAATLFRRGKRFCPLSAVVGVEITAAEFLAEKLALPISVAKDIAHAADTDDPLLLKARMRPRMLEVRRDLLEACGLKEEWR